MAPKLSLWLLTCLAGAGHAAYQITAPAGDTEDVSSLDDFLSAVNLQEYSSMLEEGGMAIDDVTAATGDDLKEMGMTKLMHRKRFLKTAATLKKAKASTKKAKAAKKKPPPPPPPAEDDEDHEPAPFLDNDNEENLIKPMPKKKRKKNQYKSDADRELAEAVEDGNIYDMEAAMKNGADINVWIEDDGDSKTPIMHATLNGNLEPSERLAMVKALLKHNPDKSLGTKASGFNALHGAGYAGFADITRVLLEAGYDPTERHADGFIAMHRACWGNQPNHTETVLVHLEHGVDVNTTAEDPKEEDPAKKIMTPLQMVVKNWANPMTMGLLESWSATGKAPDGAMETWGAEHQNDHNGHQVDVEKKRAEVENQDIDAEDLFDEEDGDDDKEL